MPKVKGRQCTSTAIGKKRETETVKGREAKGSKTDRERKTEKRERETEMRSCFDRVLLRKSCSPPQQVKAEVEIPDLTSG